MSQLSHKEGNTRGKMAQEQLVETGFESESVWHQVHVFNHYRNHLTEREKSAGRVRLEKKKLNAILQILLEMTSHSKAMSKKTLIWTSYCLIFLYSIFERKQYSKLDMKNRHIATVFSRIKCQATFSWAKERHRISGEELKTFVKNKT